MKALDWIKNNKVPAVGIVLGAILVGGALAGYDAQEDQPEPVEQVEEANWTVTEAMEFAWLTSSDEDKHLICDAYMKDPTWAHKELRDIGVHVTRVEFNEFFNEVCK